MNLTLQSDDSDQFNLGLVALKGSMTSKRILDYVQRKLEQFGLSLETDIISISTDGTSVMTCVGKLSPTHQQLCFAHAIQLAVIDILYPKNKKTPTVDMEVETTEESEEVSESDDDYESDTEIGGFQMDDPTGSEDEDVSHGHYAELISKDRKL